MTPERDSHYTLHASDLEDGRNELGIDVSHIPTGVPLCVYCDTPVPADGYCRGCEVLHEDLIERADLEPRHLGNDRWGVAA